MHDDEFVQLSGLIYLHAPRNNLLEVEGSNRNTTGKIDESGQTGVKMKRMCSVCLARALLCSAPAPERLPHCFEQNSPDGGGAYPI